MKTLTRILAATLTGAVLSFSATAALADGRHYDDRGWDHRHNHHYKHRGPAVVYAPYYSAPRAYYAPPPAYYGPPAVYEPGYYVPRPAPAVTIGISPIVIPLR